MTHARPASRILFVALATLTLAACSGGGPTPALSANSASISRSAQLNLIGNAPPSVAGTYTGTYSQTQNGQTMNGTVTMTVNQSGSSISGPFDITVQGQTANLTFSGTVSAKKDGASLKFIIMNPHGRNANAKATVDEKVLNGTAYVPPSGTQPAVFITYKTRKQ